LLRPDITEVDRSTITVGQAKRTDQVIVPVIVALDGVLKDAHADALYILRPVLAPAQQIRSGLSPGDRVIVSITAQHEPFGKIALR
jgi:hypothetical protein